MFFSYWPCYAGYIFFMYIDISPVDSVYIIHAVDRDCLFSSRVVNDLISHTHLK